MIRDFVEIAVLNLKHRKLRSWLTIIGVVIGIATVFSLVSINAGMMAAINEQFQMMGTNTIMIMPGGEGGISPVLNMLGSALDKSDVGVVETVPGVKYAIPFLWKTAKIRFHGEEKYTFVYALPSKDGKRLREMMSGVGMIGGRDILPKDRYKAIVGYRVHTDMFKDKVNTGSYIEIEGKKFKVVGVLGEIGNRMDDSEIAIPMEVAKDVFKQSENKIDMIFVRVEEGAKVEKTAKRIEEKLESHRGTKDFQVMTSSELMNRAGLILNLVSIIFISVAAISLIIGGIGIMNTMYTSVLERTREIGIMKSIGATDKEIMLIFLIESGLIGLVGGLIGIGIGVVIAKLVEVAAVQSLGTKVLRASYDPLLFIGSLSFSFLVGVISGVLPARDAARMNPVDALRYE